MKEKAAQQEFWVATQDLPKSAKTTFYDRLQSTLDECDFEVKVREIALPTTSKPPWAGPASTR